MSNEDDLVYKQMAKMLTLLCVRYSVLEDYHAQGIPIGDDEMKTFMKDVVNRIYTFLSLLEDENFHYTLNLHQGSIKKWDDPEIDKSFIRGVSIMDEIMKDHSNVS